MFLDNRLFKVIQINWFTQKKTITFSTFVSKSKSDSYIFIGSFSTLTSEYRFLDARKPLGDFKLVQKNEGLEYSVSHLKQFLHILNADNAKNFKIDVVPISNPQGKLENFFTS